MRKRVVGVRVRGVCLQVRARGMPLGTRLRSAWLALFASPACAAVMQPHPPVAEGAWLRPRPQMLAHPSGSASPNLPSEMLRISPVHFSAIARLPSGASPSPCIPPPRAGSANGGGIPRPAHSVSAEPECGRRVGAPPAPADSCGVPRPYAARSAVARLGRNTSLRRIGGISLASVRVSRRHRLRLVPPPLQPLRSTMAQGR